MIMPTSIEISSLPLSQVIAGRVYTIEEVRLTDLAEQLHLASMGLIRSATIRLVRKTPFGDPVEYLVDQDLLITLENQLAQCIWVLPRGVA